MSHKRSVREKRHGSGTKIDYICDTLTITLKTIKAGTEEPGLVDEVEMSLAP